MRFRNDIGRSLAAACVFTCLAGSVLSAPSPDASGNLNVPRATDACAEIATAFNKQGTRSFPASLAYGCLTTVKFNSKRALYIAKQMRLFTQIYSAQSFHANPPSPEMRLPAVKMNDTFAAIEKKAGTDTGYPNDYTFQVDLMKLYHSFHDGHVYYAPACAREFVFYHEYPLVMVGHGQGSLPTIHLGDYETGDAGEEVEKINGEDARKALEAMALDLPDLVWIDGDARFNDLLMNKHPINGLTFGYFSRSTYYKSENIKLKLKNGQEIDVQWQAALAREPVYKDAKTYESLICNDPKYADIANQFKARDAEDYQLSAEEVAALAKQVPRPSDEEVWRKFESDRRELRKRGAGEKVSRAAAKPTYPKPDLAMSTGEQSLTLIGNNTAVWGIHAFMGKSNSAEIFKNWQNFMTSAFALLKKDNVKRIVIDVSGNGGGYVALGLASIQMFFPSARPFYGFDLRRSPAMDLLLRLSSGSEASHLSLDSIRDIDGNDFKTLDAFLGPVHKYGDYFTTMARWDVQDAINEIGFVTTQKDEPFSKDNIVLLSDGRCGSTCAIFGEAISTIGVRAIAFNGFPDEPSPVKKMQHVGGIKGSQVWDWDTFQEGHVEKFVKNPAQYDFLPRRLPINHVSSMNLRNSYQPGSDIPLEFTWEPANGHLFATEAMWNDRTELWKAAAALAWDSTGKPLLPENVIPTNKKPDDKKDNPSKYTPEDEAVYGEIGYSYYISLFFDYKWKF
ncbi:hypothetical protein DFH27DRAFT_606238 [Peziza echinospora]|nr:hypothetical protein DFH27DRAFT_606238 [Peziza echinospora]